MTRPDLSDPQQRLAYRTELRRVYRGWRWLGLATVVAGVAAMFIGGDEFNLRSVILLGIGWAILFAVIVMRTRYHQRRMKEGS